MARSSPHPHALRNAATWPAVGETDVSPTQVGLATVRRCAVTSASAVKSEFVSLLRRLNAATRRRHRQARADDLAWRDEIAAKLDALADSQVQLRTEISEQTDAAQPSRLAMRRGRAWLAITGLFMVLFVGLTVLASYTNGQATTLEEQAQSDYLTSYQVLLPDVWHGCYSTGDGRPRIASRRFGSRWH